MSALTGDRMSLQLSRVWLVWVQKDSNDFSKGTWLAGVFSTSEKANEAADLLEDNRHVISGIEKIKINSLYINEG